MAAPMAAPAHGSALRERARRFRGAQHSCESPDFLKADPNFSARLKGELGAPELVAKPSYLTGKGRRLVCVAVERPHPRHETFPRDRAGIDGGDDAHALRLLRGEPV